MTSLSLSLSFSLYFSKLSFSTTLSLRDYPLNSHLFPLSSPFSPNYLPLFLFRQTHHNHPSPYNGEPHDTITTHHSLQQTITPTIISSFPSSVNKKNENEPLISNPSSRNPSLTLESLFYPVQFLGFLTKVSSGYS